MGEKKNIVVLGSTGSVGTQTLEVIRSLSHHLKLIGVVCKSNADLLKKQVKEFHPKYVGITHPHAPVKFDQTNRVIVGESALEDIAIKPDVNIVVVATSGIAALPATIAALKAKKIVALANKETLVAAGELIIPLLTFPDQLRTIDSEHSAVWQCLLGEDRLKIRQIILTASGGAFRDYTMEELRHAKPADAIKHPNWNMGEQITVDSATLMNKCFEVIEAHWLFGLPYSKIHALIHRQSIIHSLVEFEDGSTKAQLAVPDMRLVIQFALMFPNRTCLKRKERFLDWKHIREFTLETPDTRRFPCFSLGYNAGKKGKTFPAVLVAANEVAVRAYLQHQIGLMDIYTVVKRVLEKHHGVPVTLDSIQKTMSWAKKEAEMLCSKSEPVKI